MESLQNKIHVDIKFNASYMQSTVSGITSKWIEFSNLSGIVIKKCLFI